MLARSCVKPCRSSHLHFHGFIRSESENKHDRFGFVVIFWIQGLSGLETFVVDLPINRVHSLSLMVEVDNRVAKLCTLVSNLAISETQGVSGFVK